MPIPKVFPLCSLLLLFLCSQPAFGQQKQVLINGFTASFNYTQVADDNTKNRPGFGLGLYHHFQPEKTFNFKLGLEYNQTYQFKHSTYEGRFTTGDDLTYRLSSLSLPLTARFNLGRQVRFFLEAGGFFDLNIAPHRSGTRSAYNPLEGRYTSGTLADTPDIGHNYGHTLALGVSFPLGKKELILKPEYKAGWIEMRDMQEPVENHYFRLVIGIRERPGKAGSHQKKVRSQK